MSISLHLSFFSRMSISMSSRMSCFLLISRSQFIERRCLIIDFFSDRSFLANLNLASNKSRSRNLARISLRLVDPSFTKERESICEAIEVKRKSSIVPKCLRMAASVLLRDVPFRDSHSSPL